MKIENKFIEIVNKKNRPEEKFNDLLGFTAVELKDLELLKTFNNGFSTFNLEQLQYKLQQKLGVHDLDIRRALREKQSLSVADIEVKAFEEIVGDVLPNKDDQKKLRDEFPFLREADCPNELKILVADRITAWEKYKTAHARIVAIKEGKEEATEEELTTLAETALNSYEENRAIFEELDHYNENKTILGKHPLFLDLQLSREVNEQMTPKDLHSFKDSSPKFFSENKKKIENEKDEEKKAKLIEKVSLREKKLALVNKKLGL